MENPYLTIPLFLLVLTVLYYIFNYIGKLIKFDVLKNELAIYKSREFEIADNEKIIQEKLAQLRSQKKANMEYVETERKKNADFFDRVLSDKSEAFPWLANLYADYKVSKDMVDVDFLRNKSRPAFATAAELKKIVTSEKRDLQYKVKMLEYEINYIKSLFPESVDEDDNIILPTDETGDVETDIDPASRWLSKEEYKSLKPSERNQRALDCYFNRSKKSRWQLGKEYERYIGYLYESKGYQVTYFGIQEGFNDMGRDLIAKKGLNEIIIQCKRWSSNKMIHEKHIFQLFGTVTSYILTFPEDMRPIMKNKISGILITSTILSATAKSVARELGVQYQENTKFDRYPCIKCNRSLKDGRLIYHLPFDQQYDKVIIERNRGEFYANTIAEAESRGFSRAKKYLG